MDLHIQNIAGYHQTDRARKLTIWQLFCYGMLSFPIAMGGFVLVTYIPTFYAVDIGLGLSVVGFVFVFGRILDVVTDPLIGHLSDKTRSKWGARRPWMLLGVPFFCFAVWALFMPPVGPTLWYLILASGAYFFFYTALDVPYSSVGLEISPHLHERSVLASVKGVFQVAGALTAAAIPLLVLMETKDALSIITLGICGLSFLSLVLFMIFVPRRHQGQDHKSPDLIQSVRYAWSSRAYRFIISAFCSVQTANALIAALTVLYVVNVVKSPALTSVFLGLLFISSALFLPVWIWVSKKWSKKTAWAYSIVLAALTICTIPFIGEGDVVHLAVISLVLGSAFGCDAIMPTSMLADIVYKDELDGKGRPAALYLAMKNSVSKLTFIVPMGLAFPILDKVGFNAGDENTQLALGTLLVFYAGIPIMLRLLALGIVLKMPKTEALFS